MRRGRGLIFVTGHLGNWELAGAYVAARGIPLDAIARRMKNPLFDRYLTETRSRIGMHVVHDADAVRRTPRSLRDGSAVAFLADQGVLGPRVDVRSVLRSSREDAARTGRVRAAARRSGRVRRRR